MPTAAASPKFATSWLTAGARGKLGISRTGCFAQRRASLINRP
jgi:hypothetical protein